MPHDERVALILCFQHHSQYSWEKNLTFGNFINAKLTDGFGLHLGLFTYPCVSLSFLRAPDSTSIHGESRGKAPSLERAVELNIPPLQPALVEQLVSPWMQCLSVFKTRYSRFWHFAKVILKFLLKQSGRGAYGKRQHRHSEPHYKAH